MGWGEGAVRALGREANSSVCWQPGSVGHRAELPGCSTSAPALPEPTSGQRNRDKETLRDGA